MNRATKAILFFKRVLQIDIVKVFSLTAVSTIVKMLTGLVSIKVIALLTGPSGIALLGQLNNFSGIVLALSTGGITNGITKFISEFRGENEKVKTYLSNALIITVISSVIGGVFMIVFANRLSNIIFLSLGYDYVFIVFGITVIFYGLNMMLLAVLNGFQSFNKYVQVNIVGSIVGLIFTIIFVYTMGLKGALLSVVTYQSIVFVVTCWWLRKEAWFAKESFSKHWDKSVVKNYLHYSVMTLVSISTVPVSQLLLRSTVISQLSSTEAGWWEGMNRISNMYLTVITTAFSVYYLPKLSAIKESILLKKEIYNAYKFILPVLVIGSAFIYFFRFYIIRMLFSDLFLPMEDLFLWQLLGDFFKIASWLLAFLMVAKAMTIHFIVTEIFFSAMFLILGYLLLQKTGLIGITQAYFINYAIYLIVMLIFFRKIIFLKK